MSSAVMKAPVASVNNLASLGLSFLIFKIVTKVIIPKFQNSILLNLLVKKNTMLPENEVLISMCEKMFL